MTPNHALFVSALLIALGLCGVLLRRELIMIGFSLQISFIGMVLLFASIAAATQSNEAIALAVFAMLIFAAQSILFCGVVIFAFRHRRSLDVDEMRELRDKIWAIALQLFGLSRLYI